MAKFRKKPVVIEAIQFDGTVDGATAIERFIGHALARTYQYGDWRVQIHTLEGVMEATKADWVIKGLKGEFYPCKPDIFEATYEPAGAPADLERVWRDFFAVLDLRGCAGPRQGASSRRK